MEDLDLEAAIEMCGVHALALEVHSMTRRTVMRRIAKNRDLTRCRFHVHGSFVSCLVV